MNTRFLIACFIVAFFTFPLGAAENRPNILIAISDDQSWPYASAYGTTTARTPAFDRVAQDGVLFTQAFCASPGCSPSRAALLTGRHPWQLEHAGTHASSFDKKYRTFPELLADAGYHVGHTGKGWGPGNFKIGGREHNPAGPRFNKGGYVESFAEFLKQRPDGKPFCFWFGSSDPHRGYVKGSGTADGRKLADAEVPAFLPDTPEVRSDLLDYSFEIERFDRDLAGILELIDKAGETDNTLVIVTADNGMPFPRAKANCYEHGIHVPLAIRWPEKVPGSRTVDDLVGFVDLTATVYDAAGVTPPKAFPIAGRGLLDVLTSEKTGLVDDSRTAVFAGRERHSSSRFHSLGYPQRCIRTRGYLYVRNFKPERWPAGTPRKYAKVLWSEDGTLREGTLGPDHGGYHDIDACPTLTHLIENRADPEIGRFLELAVGKRPAVELYAVRDDPGCLNNLADDPAYAEVRRVLDDRLLNYLRETGDPRVTGNGDVWETYPRYSALRWFPTPQWAEDHPESVPDQPWLEARWKKSDRPGLAAEVEAGCSGGT